MAAPTQADFEALAEHLGLPLTGQTDAANQGGLVSNTGRFLEHMVNLPGNTLNAVTGDIEGFLPEDVRNPVKIPTILDIPEPVTGGQKLVDFLGAHLAPDIAEFAATYELGGPLLKGLTKSAKIGEALAQGASAAFGAADQGPGNALTAGVFGAAGGAMMDMPHLARTIPALATSGADYALQRHEGSTPTEALSNAAVMFGANMLPGISNVFNKKPAREVANIPPGTFESGLHTASPTELDITPEEAAFDPFAGAVAGRQNAARKARAQAAMAEETRQMEEPTLEQLRDFYSGQEHEDVVSAINRGIFQRHVGETPPPFTAEMSAYNIANLFRPGDLESGLTTAGPGLDDLLPHEIAADPFAGIVAQRHNMVRRGDQWNENIANRELLEQITGNPQTGARSAKKSAWTIMAADDAAHAELERLAQQYNPRSREDYLKDIRTEQQSHHAAAVEGFIHGPKPYHDPLLGLDPLEKEFDAETRYLFNDTFNAVEEAYRNNPGDARIAHDFEIMDNIRRRTGTPPSDQSAAILGPVLIDARGNVLAEGKIGENHAMLMQKALEAGHDPMHVITSFEQDNQHLFRDSKGRLLNRKEAAQVAYNAKQIKKPVESLHSQHLAEDAPPPLPFTKGQGGTAAPAPSEGGVYQKIRSGHYGTKGFEIEKTGKAWNVFEHDPEKGRGEWHNDFPTLKAAKAHVEEQGKIAILQKAEKDAIQSRYTADKDASGLHTYVDEQFFKENMVKPGDPGIGVQLEDVVNNEALFAKYPYLRDVEVEVVHKSHPVLNGEVARIQTLGNGEGTIYLSKSAWDDALNHKDPKMRVELGRAIIHEAAHAVQDRLNLLDGYGHEASVTDAMEQMASQFEKEWMPKPDPKDATFKIKNRGTSGAVERQAIIMAGGAVAGGLVGYTESGGDVGAALTGAMIGAGITYGGSKFMEALAHANPHLVKPTYKGTTEATIKDFRKFLTEPLKDTAGYDIRTFGSSLEKLARFSEVWMNANLPPEIKDLMVRARGMANEFMAMVEDSLKRLGNFRPSTTAEASATRYIEGNILSDAEKLREVTAQGGVPKSAYKGAFKTSNPGWLNYEIGPDTFKVPPTFRSYMLDVEERAFKRTMPADHLQYGNMVIVSRRATKSLQELLANGLPDGPIKRMIMKSAGVYTTRAFRIFHDPKFRPDPAVIDRAASEYGAYQKQKIVDAALSSGGAKSAYTEVDYNARITALTGKTDKLSIAQLDRLRTKFQPVSIGLDNYFLHESQMPNFNTYLNPDTMRIHVEGYLADIRKTKELYHMGSGKSIDTSLFTKREDLTPTWRELLGEYTNPTERQLRTVQKLASSAQASQFIGFVKDIDVNGMKAAMDQRTWSELHMQMKTRLGTMTPHDPGFAILQSQVRELETYVPLTDSVKLGALKGMRVSRFVSDQLNNYTEPFGWFDTGVGRAMANVNNISKIVHAPYNPIVHTRNWITGMAFAVIGKADPASIYVAAQAIKGRTALHGEMLRNGIIGVDFVKAELRRGIEHYFNGQYDSQVTRIARGAHNAIMEFYRIPDMWVRAGAYVAAKSRYAAELKLNPDHPDVIAKAVSWVNRRTMNYDNMPRVVNAARQIPLVNLYVSYTAEMARITKNLIYDAVGKGPDKKIDVQALAILGGLAAVPSLAEQASESALSPEDQKKWRIAKNNMPSYSRERYKYVLGKDAKGNFKYVDFTPWIITDNFNQMIRAMAHGDISAAMAVNPVVGLDNTPAFDLIAEGVTGKNIRTQREFRGWGDRLQGAAEELLPSFTPGIGYEWKRSTPEALGGRLGVTNLKTGRTDSTEGLLMRLLAGVNMTSVNQSVVSKFAMADAKNKISTERQYLNDVLKSDLSEIQKRRAIHTFQESVKVIMADFLRKQDIPFRDGGGQ